MLFLSHGAKSLALCDGEQGRWVNSAAAASSPCKIMQVLLTDPWAECFRAETNTFFWVLCQNLGPCL